MQKTENKILAFLTSHKREIIFLITAFFLLGLYASKRLKNSADAYFAVIGFSTIILCMIFSLFLCFYSHKKDLKLQTLWLLMALGFGIFRIFIITPHSGWDEYGHYEISYTYSDYLLFKFGEPHLMDANHADYTNLEIQNNVKSAYLRYKDPFFEKVDEKVDKTRTSSTPSPFQYLPQALAFAIGRLLHFNFMPLYFFGRLFNLLFYVFCIWAAIQIIPYGKLVFFTCGLSAVCLQQAASLSMDCFVLGASFLFFALLISAISKTEIIEKKEIILLCLMAFALSPSKLIYFPLAFIAILIPSCRFKSLKQNILIKALVIFSGIFSIILFSALSVKNTSDVVEGVKIIYSGEQGWTLKDILHNPGKVAGMAMWTLRYTWADWFSEALGKPLIGVPGPFPLWGRQITLLLMLASALFYTNEDENASILTFWQKMMIVFVLLCVVGLSLAGELYIWTPVNAKSIEGVQGRYFLPVFPLILFLFRNKIIVTNRDLTCGIFIAEIFLQFYTVFMVVNLTL